LQYTTASSPNGPMPLPATPAAPLTREGLRAAMTTPAPAATPAAAPRPVASAPSPATPTATPALTPASNRPQLTPQQFEVFAKMIYDLSGMKFEANKSYFVAGKLDNRIQALGLKGFDDYQRYLESPSGRAEYGFMIDEVTINETFFYRHEPQLQGFINEVLHPMVQARKTQGIRKFRIWSAAASTGDELYTIALILKEQGLLGKDMAFELIGTDISHEALAKARAGIYKKYNIRNIPPSVLTQNFTTGPDDTYVLKADIKAMCRFQEMNLMDSARIASLGKFDVIFIRNVLIYFDEKSKEHVVQNLCSVLADDGVVLVGHSENIYSQRHLLKVDKARPASIAHIKAPPGTQKM
jgi:chemotaxis protein methyltransferase CheR